MSYGDDPNHYTVTFTGKADLPDTDAVFGWSGANTNIIQSSDNINPADWQWVSTGGGAEERVPHHICVICGSSASRFFCELCRQAVLDLRKAVVRRMARDMLEMESD